MSRMIEYISDESYAEEVGHGGLILLDFSADWCEPCKAMEPALLEIDETYGERLRVFKVDLDECPGLVEHFSVMSIPTLILLLEGEPKRRLNGPRTYQQLSQEVSELLGDS